MISLTACPKNTQEIVWNNEARIDEEIFTQFSQLFKSHSFQQPIILLLGGFQGSGKSTVTEALKSYDFCVISTDAIRQAFFDRNVQTQHNLSERVNSVFKKLLTYCVNNHLNVLVDANAHAKRINEITNLLGKDHRYSLIKIFLEATQDTLQRRVNTRVPVHGKYQGTEKDLLASLSSIQINSTDYDFIIDTDKLSLEEELNLVKSIISPYFAIQN